MRVSPGERELRLVLEVQLSGPLTETVGATIKSTYNHTWSTSDSVSVTETIGVPGGCTFQLGYKPAIERDTGTFTVTIGNTTWSLPDVYFDSPDKTSDAVIAGTGWTYEAHPISADKSCTPSVTNVSHS